MMVRRPHLWIALFSGLAVIAVALVDSERTSPGPLTHVHATVAELAGGTSCASCHGGWFESMAESCLECHADVATQLEEQRGLHGTQDPARATQCAVCHGEHHGAGFAIVSLQSFVRAGIPVPEDFDHALLGYRMEGRHMELDCAECHVNADLGVLPHGEKRFLGLDSACQSCHEDPHEGAMRRDCTQCHSQLAFTEQRFEGHERWLPLVGGHAGLDCRTCHAEGGPRALEELWSGRQALATRGCEDCHASPHAEGFVGGVARLVSSGPVLASLPVARRGSDCLVCHVDEHTSFAASARELTPAQHAVSGFPLDAPHDELACEGCHAGDLGSFARRFPGRGADACAACHEDPHRGQFDHAPFARRGCLACHERQAFEPHRFDEAQHARTAFELSGSHLALECAACHEEPQDGGPRRFHGTAGECASCHADAHRGFFAERLAGLPPVPHGECARCHDSGSFSDVPADRFDHTAWTGFAVVGAHAQNTCESCHERAHQPDAAGRTFGRVSFLGAERLACASCHEDPHRGRFDRPGLPAQVEGRRGCERCHVQTSMRALPYGFAHERWTDFALDGMHGEVGCAACHEPLRGIDPKGRTWSHASGRLCADCHDDPHAGQFAEEGVTSCERCHQSAAGFEQLIFDHDRDSRFPLEEAHAALDCSACHKRDNPRKADEVLLYKPLGTDCVSCHGVHEEPLLRSRGRKR